MYYTWTGGTIKGVSYTAPTDAGNYVVTAHVAEKGNYTAHEVSANFTIAKAPLIIDADELVRMQYESYPDMVATFKGLVGSDAAPDTSLRDVQIQPEFIFNEVNGGYTNAALDQVGADYPITVRNALSRNYEITYVGGSMVVNAQDANADLAIHGMIDNGSSTENVAYYGDVIQLYAYGNYGKAVTGAGDRHNTSCLINWSLSSGAPATIDSQDGLLTITGVGTFTVTLTRGTGTAAISTTLTIEALKKEVKVSVPDEDVVYNAATQTYTVGNMKAYDEKFNPVSAVITDGNTTRIPVGSQIVTGKVADSVAYYQSETYGGLFTINDKEVTVAPVAASVVYGETLGALTYSETGTVGGVDALTNGKAVSIRDSYVNLDVLDGYEILVAGVENMNYNVKYVTDQIAPDAQVTAKPLTFKTGVINSDGRTSGYMKNNSLFFEDAGFAITGTTFNANPNDRMYGEVNPVMDYRFDELIAGDSEADLANLLPWLVEYSDGTAHNINGDANVKFNKTQHLAGYRATTATEFISGAVNNYVIDGMLTTGGVKNYTTTVAAATQNIYQRPFTLKLTGNKTELKVYQPLILTGGTVDASKVSGLLQLIKDNTYVDLYKGEGGLATKLGHTDSIIDLKIVGTPTYDSATKELTVNLVCGNTNYWMAPIGWKIKIDPSMISVSYGTLGKYSSSVTMYGFDEHGNNIGAIDVTGKVWYEIYVEDTSLERKYSNYKDLTPVVRVQMTKGSGKGVYVANYNSTPLSAGHYVMFAIAEDYTIIE